MRYLDAFTFVFRHPRWLPNLLILTVANLVPLIGPIFAFGYSAAVAESLRGGRHDGSYHAIESDRIGDYLLRGLRMFLVSVLAAFVIVPIYLAVVFTIITVSALGTAATGQGADGSGAIGSALGCVVTGGGMVVLLATMLVVAVVLLPMHLRAGLNPELGAVFSVAYVRDFLRRVPRECVLFYLVLIVAAIPLGIAGLLALIVGVFAVAAYLHLVQAHLLAQLADLYEARGGESVSGASPTFDSEMPTPPPLPR